MGRVDWRNDRPGHRRLRRLRASAGLQLSPHLRRGQEAAGSHRPLADRQRRSHRHLPREFRGFPKQT